jgi:hypothetical protein
LSIGDWFMIGGASDDMNSGRRTGFSKTQSAISKQQSGTRNQLRAFAANLAVSLAQLSMLINEKTGQDLLGAFVTD